MLGPRLDEPDATVVCVEQHPQSRPSPLKLVWSGSGRPKSVRRLDVAIEHHLQGDDGLTDEQFAVLHATGRPVLVAVERS